MDSLRYWAIEMHVDGFRFDLAPALARENGEYAQGSAFFDAIRQDPALAGVKLIAEPWDLGPGGYQLGNFPPGWAEWNAPVPRYGAPLLEGRSRAGRRNGLARRRLVRHLRLSRPAALGEHQFRHRP